MFEFSQPLWVAANQWVSELGEHRVLEEDPAQLLPEIKLEVALKVAPLNQEEDFEVDSGDQAEEPSAGDSKDSAEVNLDQLFGTRPLKVVTSADCDFRLLFDSLVYKSGYALSAYHFKLFSNDDKSIGRHDFWLLERLWDIRRATKVSAKGTISKSNSQNMEASMTAPIATIDEILERIYFYCRACNQAFAAGSMRKALVACMDGQSYMDSNWRIFLQTARLEEEAVYVQHIATWLSMKNAFMLKTVPYRVNLIGASGQSWKMKLEQVASEMGVANRGYQNDLERLKRELNIMT